MSDARSNQLIDELAGALTPVQRLAPPLARALLWSAVVIAVGIVAAIFADIPALKHRLMATPDMWLAVLGSTLTAFLAVFAAFELNLPDRSARWVLLPLPSTLLWIIASGAGCLRSFTVSEVRDPTLGDERDCFLIILGLSIPLSFVLLAMLRRGYSLLPGLTAAVGGLAVAAAAATLLMFFHPFDATLSDLIAHGTGVAIVIVTVRWIGSRNRAPKNISAGL